MTNEVEDKTEEVKPEPKPKPELTAIDNEIRDLRRHVKRLKKIPRALHPLISYTYQYDGTRIIPIGGGEGEQTESARKMRGHLERAGVTLEVKKEKSYGGDETMFLTWLDGDDRFSIANYMPKTCRRKVELVDVEAEEEKITPAVAAHKVERVIIECDGLPSQVISVKKIPASKDATEEQVEKDLNSAELDAEESDKASQ